LPAIGAARLPIERIVFRPISDETVRLTNLRWHGATGRRGAGEAVGSLGREAKHQR